MGDAAQSALNYFWKKNNYSSRKRKRTFQSGSGHYKWKTSSGEIVNMKDMTKEHLCSAIGIARKLNSGKLKELKEIYEKHL